MSQEKALQARQPVLVGIGVTKQREDDFRQAREPMDLMLDAVRQAGVDAAGGRAAQLLREVQHIAVPRGRWRYRNPAGELARSIGADGATTVLASVGVLQQSLIGEACSRIAAGQIDAALVAGADTGYRILRARQAGERAPERQQEDSPNIQLEPVEELLHPAEVKAGIRMPVALYAILESAFRNRRGWTVDGHRDRLAHMLARFSVTAADNPDAWRRRSLQAAAIREGSEANPMQAFPYTRLHCTSWNVDQAAALLVCSAAKAQALGIPRNRWVYACASTESNHMVPVSAREDLAGCDAAAVAGHAALEAGGIDASGVDLLDLYSCFPVAVEAQADALGISLERELTVTGGMPFAGGPFNNYVLQATCRMAWLLRRNAGRAGLVSSVSGILTKQGFGLWSRQPLGAGFRFLDLSVEVRARARVRTVLETFAGPARIAGYTVLHDKGEAPRALVLADTPGGERVLAASSEPALADGMQRQEFCGATIDVEAGRFRLS